MLRLSTGYSEIHKDTAELELFGKLLLLELATVSYRFFDKSGRRLNWLPGTLSSWPSSKKLKGRPVVATEVYYIMPKLKFLVYVLNWALPLPEIAVASAACFANNFWVNIHHFLFGKLDNKQGTRMTPWEKKHNLLLPEIKLHKS